MEGQPTSYLLNNFVVAKGRGAQIASLKANDKVEVKPNHDHNLRMVIEPKATPLVLIPKKGKKAGAKKSTPIKRKNVDSTIYHHGFV
jgi:hypothetical protein